MGFYLMMAMNKSAETTRFSTIKHLVEKMF